MSLRSELKAAEADSVRSPAGSLLNRLISLDNERVNGINLQALGEKLEREYPALLAIGETIADAFEGYDFPSETERKATRVGAFIALLAVAEVAEYQEANLGTDLNI